MKYSIWPNFIDFSFNKLNDTSCSGENTYGEFRCLSEAKEACFHDDQCKGVFNASDLSPKFWLCYVGYEYRAKEVGSIVYDKKGKVISDQDFWFLGNL